MITLTELGHAWQTFFHQPEGLATICLFRCLFGLLVAINAGCMLPRVHDLLGPNGFVGQADFEKMFPFRRLTMFHLLPASDAVAKGVVWLLLIVGVALSVGFLTSIAAPLCWLLLVSIHHRNPLVFNSGDALQRLLALLFCFVPSGLSLSVDCWLAGRDAFDSFHNETFDPWALRLMQIQISIVYLRSIYWKLRGKTWWDGTAVGYAIQSEFYRRRLPPAWMLRPWVYRSATYGTLLAEVFAGVGPWVKELRWYALIMTWGMHLGFEYFLSVHLFGATMSCGLLLFVPAADLAWVLDALLK